MAEPLKYMYHPGFFESLCPVLRKCIPGFDGTDFIFRIFDNTWADLGLKARVRRISTVLRHFLPDDFPQAASLLVTVSRELQNRPRGFEYIFIPDYVEVFGAEFPDESLAALSEITRLVSAEFAVRPFIYRYPQKTFRELLKWSTNADARVRRLSSEGSRPRLPWGMGLPSLKRDPAPVFPILENLKKDECLSVRKSVANHINDIAKDHPDVVMALAKEWAGTHAYTDWIIRHGCRTLLKKGNAGALQLHGFHPGCKSDIRDLTLHKKKIRIGDDLAFAFDFINTGNRSAKFMIEYAIDYLTSTGKISRKIFRITERSLQAGETISIQRKRSFRDLATRKHFRGRHQLAILANGKKLISEEFMVC